MTAGTAVIMWLGELDHRPRRRQRHVDADLHLDHRPVPRAGRGRSSRPRARSPSRVVLAVGLAIVALRRLRRAGAAPDPGAVRQAHGRPPDVRRHVDVHPAQGQQAGVIPVIFASSLLYIPPLIVQLTSSDSHVGWASVGAAALRQAATTRSTSLTYFAADHLLHLLLRRDHLQPGRGRRQHEEVRRLHPRHPGRPADRRVPRLRAVPPHRCPARSTSASSPCSRSFALRPARRQRPASRSAARAS